jgi:hypothetical protein
LCTVAATSYAGKGSWVKVIARLTLQALRIGTTNASKAKTYFVIRIAGRALFLDCVVVVAYLTVVQLSPLLLSVAVLACGIIDSSTVVADTRSTICVGIDATVLHCDSVLCNEFYDYFQIPKRHI